MARVGREKRKALGLCIECRNPPMPALEGRRMCQEHSTRAYHRLKGYKEKNPEYFKELNFKSHLKQNYNLTLENYQDLWDTQQGRCAIVGCEVDFSTYHKRPEIDHDHSCCPGYKSCGKCVRALLCGPHNKALGDVKDSTEQLLGLIKYLEKFERVSQNG